MNTVVKAIKRSFTVYSALFITLITTRVRGEHHSNCRPEELLQCAKPLSVLTDSGLTFVSSKADLERMCPDLKDALKCIHSYTRHCMGFKHRSHFKKLFHGTGVMVHQLCENGTYQDEYLKYTPCMKAVAHEHESCFHRYSTAMKDIHTKTQQNEDGQGLDQQDELYTYKKKKRDAEEEGLKNVCCSFQEYVECSTHAMRRECGEDAARFSKAFLDRMSSSMIQEHCSDYGLEVCPFYSSSTNFFTSKFLLTLLPLLYFVFLS